jgi:hypothetical protein
MFGLNYTPSKFLEPKNISPSRRTWKRIGQKNILTSQTCRPVPHTRPTTSSDDATSPQPPPIQSNNGHGSSRETGRTGHRPDPEATSRGTCKYGRAAEKSAALPRLGHLSPSWSPPPLAPAPPPLQKRAGPQSLLARRTAHERVRSDRRRRRRDVGVGGADAGGHRRQ